MFWKFDLHPNSSLDTILSKEVYSLSEILDEDDVLQECKSQNRKLLDFLVKPEILEELVEMITKEPAEDVDEKLRYKYPNIACELLISDVQMIVEQLTTDTVLLNKLWTFLECESPLNPLLASFFSKVISLLISRKTVVVLEFLKSKENAVDLILRHIDTSAIMDLVLRLATNVEVNELRFELLQWLNEQKLIEKLVDFVDPQYSSDRIGNAAQALCDLIKTSREYMSQLQENAYPDPLLATIENKETLTTLLDHMLHEVHLNSSSDSLVGGVCVLLTLLEVNKTNSESPFANIELGEPVTALDAERLAHGVTITLSALVPRLEGFHKILTDPPPMCVMITTVGKLDPPFGKSRLQVMKLLSAILQTKSKEANKEIANLATLQVIWGLFFQYPWNNFLHGEVEHCINTIICDSPLENEGDHLLLDALMKDINIIHKITEIFSNQEKGKDTGLKRHGYMGHLTKIANDVYQGMEKGKNQEKISALYNELEQDDKDCWEQFVSGKLAEVNRRNAVDLAGRHPLHSSDDDDDDYHPVSFLRNGNVGSYQQTFTHYQMQHMAPEFLDNIGFDEEQFPESDEQMSAPFDRISDVNFGIDTHEDNPNSAMFETACNERIHAFDDNDSDEEDVWPTKEISFSSAVELKSSASEESESSESEEEEGRDEKRDEVIEFDNIRTSSPFIKSNEENKMDVDHNDVWTTTFESSSSEPISMEVQAVEPVGWNNEGNNDDNKGWAKFDDLSTISDIPCSPITPIPIPVSEPRASSPVAMDTEVSSPAAAYVIGSEEDEMIDQHSKNEPESNIDNKDDKQPETEAELQDNRLEGDVPLAPSEDDDEEDDEEDDEDDVASRLQTNETTTNNEENKSTEQNSECCTQSAVRTCEDPPNEINTENNDGQSSHDDGHSDNDGHSDGGQANGDEQPQHDVPESGTSPEKIPVSARNGPSLS